MERGQTAGPSDIEAQQRNKVKRKIVRIRGLKTYARPKKKENRRGSGDITPAGRKKKQSHTPPRLQWPK